MSDNTLVDYYSDYAPKRFPRAKSRRTQQDLAKRYRLPLIRVGYNVLIDPIAGDNRLRELAKHQEPEQRRLGRPRIRIEG